MIKRLLFLLLSLITSTYSLNSQCGCPGNSTEISLGNLNELYDKQEYTGNNLFVNLLYKNSYADSYYSGEENIGPGPISSIASNFMNLRISYKPRSEWIVEFDIGYLVDKTQNERLSDDVFKSAGLSDVTLYGRYIFYKSLISSIEISGGSGVKVPLNKGSEFIPQNIQPSTGAYAVLLNIFIKKYIPDFKSGIILGNRTDFNFYNSWDYKYGNSYITSLVYLYNFDNNLNFGFEIRNDIRGKDFDNGEIIDASGMYSIAISPLIRYVIHNFTISGYYNYPVYQYYYGEQIGNKFSFGFSLSYNTNL